MAREQGDAGDSLAASSAPKSISELTPGTRTRTPTPPKKRSPQKKDDFDPRRLVISWTCDQIARIQPWKEFFDTNTVTLPNTTQEIGRRIPINLDRYRSNYGVIFLFLLAFCFMSTPARAAGVAAVVALCAALRLHVDEDTTAVLGTGLVLGKLHRAGIALFVSLPLLYALDLWSSLVWSGTACLFLTLGHASLHQAAPLAPAKKLEDIPEEGDTTAF
ncbi:prenylated Rab acceptor protein 1-like [Ornithodoros turicata]|uniref:prenylated Rab acceptor protein 1-like n=1 Tax=Ornithodoros turicata TaxID=34597 RepID=UPI0031394ED0